MNYTQQTNIVQPTVNTLAQTFYTVSFLTPECETKHIVKTFSTFLTGPKGCLIEASDLPKAMEFISRFPIIHITLERYTRS